MTITLRFDIKKQEKVTLLTNESFTGKSGIKYDLQQDHLGSGGNSTVMQCAEASSGQEYAVKFAVVKDGARIARFNQEVDLLKAVSHPQLMRYVDHGTIEVQTFPKKDKTETLPFLITELATETLLDFCKRQKDKRVPFELYAAQFKGLALALKALHEKAIHRDIKPENILISGESWLLSDLGLCKSITGPSLDLTVPGEKIGPRFWMSPEAVNNALGSPDGITTQSDLFQLCSVFWFVVTGRHPTGNVTEADWDGPPKLFPPVFSGLTHNLERRVKSAGDLHDSLETALLS